MPSGCTSPPPISGDGVSGGVANLIVEDVDPHHAPPIGALPQNRNGGGSGIQD